MATKDFLLEIGTEELPPKSLRKLMESLAGEIETGLAGFGLSHGNVRSFATPRRLAVMIGDLEDQQQDQQRCNELDFATQH